MSRQKRTYTAEFKREALQLWQSSGRSAANIETELDITHGMLTKWRARAGKNGKAAFPGHGKQTPEQAEIRRQEREIVQLRLERDILKKAVAIFSQPGK
jgi:transposase